jgi:hypothetical protein
MNIQGIVLFVTLPCLVFLSCSLLKPGAGVQNPRIPELNAQIKALENQGSSADSARDSLIKVRDSLVFHEKRLKRGIMLKIRTATCCLYNNYVEDYEGKYHKYCKGIKCFETVRMSQDQSFEKNVKFESSKYLNYGQTYYLEFKCRYFNRGRNYINCDQGKDYFKVYKLTTPGDTKYSFVIIYVYSEGMDLMTFKENIH